MCIRIEVPDETVVAIYVWIPNYCPLALKHPQKLL